MEIITGKTPDISEYFYLKFYDWVIYKSNAVLDPPQLGKFLVVSHHIGKIVSYWVLPVSGISISCETIQQLTFLEKQTD